jgi:hypothetical protein
LKEMPASELREALGVRGIPALSFELATTLLHKRSTIPFEPAKESGPDRDRDTPNASRSAVVN